MAHVIYSPPRPPKPRERTVVAGRVAWFYREGTRLQTRSGVWVCTHDHEYDSFPWWTLERPDE